jgi:hypothetical protein
MKWRQKAVILISWLDLEGRNPLVRGKGAKVKQDPRIGSRDARGALDLLLEVK